MCVFRTRASRVGAARVGVPTYARNRAGRRDLGRRQVNTPLTYAFFPLVPFALTPSFLISPSLSLSFSISYSLFHAPACFPALLPSRSRYTCLRIYIGYRFLYPHYWIHARWNTRAYSTNSRRVDRCITVGNSTEAFLSFLLFPFYQGCARICVCRRVLQTSRRIYLRLISPSPSVLLQPHPSHLLAPSM